MNNKTLPDGISGDPNRVAPMKRPFPVDTPPVAETADDGSDFYDTPRTASTPVSNEQDMMNAIPNHAGDLSAPSKPAAQIPGLNLLNNGLNGVQPNNDSISRTENQEPIERAKPQAHVSSAEIGTDQNSQGPAPMDVEQEGQNETAEQNLHVDANGANLVPATEQTDGPPEGDGPREWETDSSPYESSSDDSTSSDDSDDDDEDYPILSPEEQARILMAAEGGSDDEGDGNGGKAAGQTKTANEVVEEVLPVPEVEITPDSKLVHLGHVQTIVENILLIEANTTGEYQVLESGSLLCTEDRNIAGVISETLGRVENPLYTVRYPTAAAIEERGLVTGKPIYYVENHSTFVFTQPLKGMKGSDASNFHDEEIGEDEIEFSDDEAEADHKRKLKQKRQEKKEARGDAGGSARGRRGHAGPSKLRQTELNYDDAVDGYTPLSRPKNLHEMMGHREAPVEADGPPGSRGGFRGGRGRGRGSDRGRGGGRGRGGRPGENHSHHDQRPYSQPENPPAYSQPQYPNYSQPAHQQSQQPAYGMPQQFAQFAPFFQQQQQSYAQSPPPQQFPFQMPQQQGFPQANPYQQMSPNVHINPAFFAALQQQQAQQQQQQLPQQMPAFSQAQSPAMNFDQVKAQLDILRQLNNGNQGPPPG